LQGLAVFLCCFDFVLIHKAMLAIDPPQMLITLQLNVTNAHARISRQIYQEHHAMQKTQSKHTPPS
jgi:hypothetical protein